MILHLLRHRKTDVVAHAQFSCSSYTVMSDLLDSRKPWSTQVVLSHLEFFLLVLAVLEYSLLNLSQSMPCPSATQGQYYGGTKESLVCADHVSVGLKSCQKFNFIKYSVLYILFWISVFGQSICNACEIRLSTLVMLGTIARRA